jgi:hypothetical protein
MRGWALAQRSHEPGAGQGQGEEGMAQIQRGLAAWGATGAKVFRPYGLTLLAEAPAVVDDRGSAAGKPRGIDSRASSCWRARRSIMRRRKLAFVKPLTRSTSNAYDYAI